MWRHGLAHPVRCAPDCSAPAPGEAGSAQTQQGCTGVCQRSAIPAELGHRATTGLIDGNQALGLTGSVADIAAHAHPECTGAPCLAHIGLQGGGQQFGSLPNSWARRAAWLWLSKAVVGCASSGQCQMPSPMPLTREAGQLGLIRQQLGALLVASNLLAAFPDRLASAHQKRAKQNADRHHAPAQVTRGRVSSCTSSGWS